MNHLASLVQRLRPLLTPTRLQFYLAALFLPQVVLFLSLETTSGVLDRQNRVRGRDFIAFYVKDGLVDAVAGFRSVDVHNAEALIRARKPVDLSKLRDESVQIADLA